MRELIKRLIKNEKYLDIFVIDIGMAQYVKDYTAVRKVLFQPYIESLFYDEYKNTISNIAMKCLVALESAKLRKQEQSIMNKFDEIVTVTQKDANFLGARLKDPSKCIYRTTGIDTDYFTPRQEDPGTNNILFFGSLYWYPNLDQIRWFLKEIWPPLKGRVPGITVTIIGDGAPRDILRYSNKPGFSVLGYVDDVRPYLRNTALMALPVRICGGGLRTKILVAMASRVPVVSTSLGCAGLGVTHDKDIIIADGEKNFADALEMVIRDTDLRNRLADNGYIFAKENFKWKNL
jgi:glycosyltransferase involved in cell wall biosynthesis